VAFAPVNVITGEAEFLQTDVVPLTVAIGKGLTTKGTLIVKFLEHCVDLFASVEATILVI
jgi:hypothetical protein